MSITSAGTPKSPPAALGKDKYGLGVVLQDSYAYPCFKYFIECVHPTLSSDLCFYRNCLTYHDSPSLERAQSIVATFLVKDAPKEIHARGGARERARAIKTVQSGVAEQNEFSELREVVIEELAAATYAGFLAEFPNFVSALSLPRPCRVGSLSTPAVLAGGAMSPGNSSPSSSIRGKTVPSGLGIETTSSQDCVNENGGVNAEVGEGDEEDIEGSSASLHCRAHSALGQQAGAATATSSLASSLSNGSPAGLFMGWSRRPSTTTGVVITATSPAAPTVSVAFGVKRGRCRRPDCDCSCFQFPAPTFQPLSPKSPTSVRAGEATFPPGTPPPTANTGGPCLQCGHYPSEHENLGPEETLTQPSPLAPVTVSAPVSANHTPSPPNATLPPATTGTPTPPPVSSTSPPGKRPETSPPPKQTSTPDVVAGSSVSGRPPIPRTVSSSCVGMSMPPAVACGLEAESAALPITDSRNKDGDTWFLDRTEVSLDAEPIGSGRSATVFKGRWRNQDVAVKVLKEEAEAKTVEDFQLEFKFLRSLRSPHFVYFYGVVLDGSRVWFLLEWCGKGSLNAFMTQPEVNFTWDLFLKFAQEAARGLSCLHNWKPQIVHRDFKSHNLLITDNWQLKISDFGLSRFLDSNNETLGKVRGTYAYCIAEGTPISLHSGLSVPIERVRGGEMLQICDRTSIDFRGKTLGAAFNIHTAPRQCVVVELADGTRLAVTPDHRLLAFSPASDEADYVQARDLVAGADSVVCSALYAVMDYPCGEEEDDVRWSAQYLPSKMERHELLAVARLLGFLFPRYPAVVGSYLDAQQIELDLQLVLHSEASPLLFEEGKWTLPEDAARKVLRKIGCWSVEFRREALLELLHGAPRCFRREFIASLWGVIGEIPSLLEGDEADSFSMRLEPSSHLQFLRDFVLSDFGVFAAGGQNSLVLSGSKSISEFARVIGLRYSHEKVSRLDVLRRWLQIPSCSVSLCDFSKAVCWTPGCTTLRIPVVRVGREPTPRLVYDLTVPLQSNFVAAGCVVHNCCPEVYFGRQCTDRSDVFSLGIVLWEMAVRCLRGEYLRPYAEFTDMQFDFQILLRVSKNNLRPTVPPNCPPEVSTLIKSCWDATPESRPSASQALQALVALEQIYRSRLRKWDKLRTRPKAR